MAWLLSPTASSVASTADSTITQRVLVVAFDPIMANKGGLPLHQVYSFGGGDPVDLTSQLIADLESDSHGVVRYQIAQAEVVNAFPYEHGGFQYTDETYAQDADSGHFRGDDLRFDYNRFLSDYSILPRIASGDIDEVWVWGAGGFGMWESTMAGDGAYWCNSSPVQGVSSDRAFVIMGLNFELPVGYALHSYGHRVESIMRHIYGRWEHDQADNWSKFTLLDKDAPGLGGVGNVHFPVNGVRDYDYANPTYVLSNADDWYSYPTFTGNTRLINFREWSPDGADPQREYLNWWYDHIPHFAGVGPDGYLNDWWRYVIGVDGFKALNPFLSAGISPAAGVWGTTFTVSGLASVQQGGALVGKTVTLQRLGPLGWTSVGATTTRAGGAYSLSAGAPSATSRYRVLFSAWGPFAAATSPTVVAGVRVGVTLVAADRSPRPGKTVALSGRVLPIHPGKRVALLQLGPSGWHSIETTTVDASSAYRFTVLVQVAASRVYRVAFPTQDADHLWNMSKALRITWS